MAKRRSRGEGGLHWNESRQRWVCEVTVGYTPAGKRTVRRASGRTKTEAKTKLKELLRDHDDGYVIAPQGYTVAQAVNDWLDYGLNSRDPETVRVKRSLATNHVVPSLGSRKLRELTADDVDKWLAEKAESLSTITVREIRSILKRAISRAQARDKVKRNVVLLCDCPTGQPGRPSKSLTLGEAEKLLDAADSTAIGAYVTVSLLTGARTEELRALKWSHVDLDGDPDANPPIPPNIRVWRSVRSDGDTKTKKSRRSLAIPDRAVQALQRHRSYQDEQRTAASDKWREQDYVFATKLGTEMDDANVRRDFRRVVKSAGIDPRSWTPRELRHSFVSLLSDAGISLEQISRLVGHLGTATTDLVYRHQIRPVIQDGATAMNRIFQSSETPNESDSHSVSHSEELKEDAG
jgi:integrase